jgi:predicted nucleotidyltransferase
MVARDDIQALCDRIVEEFRPEKVVLFGSHAYGTPRPDSDVDLLVIMPFEGQPAYQAIEILERVDPPFGIDLLARTPAQVAERLALGDFFMREIMARGKVLYDAAHARVGG